MNRINILYPYLPKDYVKKHNFLDDNQSCDLKDDNPLNGVIFQPDPETGLPRSDLQIIMSKDSNPEVSQYIRDNLLSAHNSGGTLDVDEALVTTRTQAQSLQSLKSDIVGFIDKKQNSK